MSLDKRKFCDILSNVQFLLDEKENDADKKTQKIFKLRLTSARLSDIL